jgi:hypothetical protein
MLQMQTFITFVLLLSSGINSSSFEKEIILAEFISDFYKMSPPSCLFLMQSEAKQQGEIEFYILYISCLRLLNKIYLSERWEEVFKSYYI